MSGGVKPKRLRWEEIRQRAEEFRKKYVEPPDRIPVPVEEILEFDLGIIPLPKKGLLQEIDVDGFLSRDLQYLIVDADIYDDPRQENRLRFTYAHEIGHFVLHKEEIQGCEFRTEEDWIHFREDMSEDDLFWFEQQAYEFAGRLLVPVDHLRKTLDRRRSKVKVFRDEFGEEDDEFVIEAISRIIYGKFGVSEGVIKRRIKSERLWTEII